MAGFDRYRFFSGSKHQRRVWAAESGVTVGNLNPVSFRQTDNHQLWRHDQQFTDPLFAGLAFMSFRQGVGEVWVKEGAI